MRGPKQ